jgi:YebC/PmpR family DNA-binding regulatory protein
MSGHSKWATIKRQKAITDSARGKIFTRLSKEITLAAQEGGGDPQLNFSLRVAIDKAKAANCPAENITRAIKKGTGELKDGSKIVEIVYEAYGPGNVGLLIKSQTDNINRAITEIRQVVEGKHEGKMAVVGSVSWQFEEKGIFVLAPQKYVESNKYGQEGKYVSVNADELVLELMELPEIEDLQQEEGGEQTIIEVVSAKEKYSQLAGKLSDLKIKIEESGIGFKATQYVKLDSAQEEALQALIDNLDELDDVDQVWTNIAL